MIQLAIINKVVGNELEPVANPTTVSSTKRKRIVHEGRGLNNEIPL